MANNRNELLQPIFMHFWQSLPVADPTIASELGHEDAVRLLPDSLALLQQRQQEVKEFFAVLSRGYPSANRPGAANAEKKFRHSVRAATAILHSIFTSPSFDDLLERITPPLQLAASNLARYVIAVLDDFVEAGICGEHEIVPGSKLARTTYFKRFDLGGLGRKRIGRLVGLATDDEDDEAETEGTLWKHISDCSIDSVLSLLECHDAIERDAQLAEVCGAVPMVLRSLVFVATGTRFVLFSEPVEPGVPRQDEPEIHAVPIICLSFGKYVLVHQTGEPQAPREWPRHPTLPTRHPSNLPEIAVVGAVVLGITLIIIGVLGHFQDETTSGTPPTERAPAFRGSSTFGDPTLGNRVDAALRRLDSYRSATTP